MNFYPSDEQINAYKKATTPHTISEFVSKQTLFGLILLLRQNASSICSPESYPCVRNIKPIDCDKLYEFLNAIADRLECLAGLRKEGAWEPGTISQSMPSKKEGGAK